MRISNFLSNVLEICRNISPTQPFRRSLQSYLLREYDIAIVDAANAHFCDDCYSKKKFLFL